jgi:hypothetical protein
VPHDASKLSKSISSVQTNQLNHYLDNLPKNKSSLKSSFVTMGDEQIENLRNMLFGEDKEMERTDR